MEYSETARFKYALEKLKIDNFIDTRCNNVKSNHNRIKVRIVLYNIITLNTIDGLISFFHRDERYDLLLLIKLYSEKMINFCNNNCYKYKFIFNNLENYSLEDDCPDILILYSWTDQSDFGNIRKYTKLLIALSSAIHSERYKAKDFWKFLTNKTFGKYNPDYFLFDSLLYKFFKDNAIDDNRIVEMGNPKFDGIYRATKNRIRVKSWEKLEGRTVVAYCPDHGIYDLCFDQTNTFDIYGQAIFQWAYEHPEIGLIFRPHAGLVNELKKFRIWSEEGEKILKYYLHTSPNIVWDEHDTYHEAFSNCDAVLTDAYCGIACTALPMGKPLGILYRDGSCQPIHESLAQSLYEIKNVRQLTAFLGMLSRREDPKKMEREKASYKYVKHFDGKNASRIKQFIDDRYQERFGLKV